MTTSVEVLEFEALRELLGRYVSSAPGKRELEKVSPHHDAARLAADLAEAGEAIQYLHIASKPQPAARGAAIRLDFGAMPDVEAAVAKLRVEGAGLEPREIFELFSFLDLAADARSNLSACAERVPLLAARANSIGEFRNLLRELDGKILPDGSVA
ncbi:MAG: endonuclease MutS2, partial [Acidobacteriota bacterium]|nr:endonuclease MutS2 [Acidobacteriota bacterium]